MATKTINNVQYKLRGDSYTNWAAKTVTLADREPAIVRVAANEVTAAGVKAAGTYLKIGDGTTEFKALPYVSCLVKAQDIDGLEDFIAGEIQDTDTQYKLEQDTDNKHILKLSSKDKGSEQWNVVATITTEDTVYTAKDNSIEIDATGKTIGVKLASGEDNALKLENDGLKVVLPNKQVVSVQKKATATEGYLTSYEITVDGEPVGVSIDIPKDFLVKSAATNTVVSTDKESGGKFAENEGFAVGDKYIDFTINVKDGTASDEHIYLNVKDLAHVYTAGNGIAISNTDVISVKIDSDNANGLEATEAGLKLNPASADNAGAMSAADYSKLAGMSTGANKVEQGSENGKIKVDGQDMEVYKLPETVLDSTDSFVFDGGNA